MINDETLTLYYYDDGLTSEERQAVAEALLADQALTERYAALCERLDGWRNPVNAEPPSHALQQWHDSIDRAAQLEAAAPRRPGSFHLLSFAWGGALVAAIALAIGLYLSGGPDVAPTPDNPVADVAGQPATAVPASFTRGLQIHLRHSRAELAELTDETQADRYLLLLQIIQQNRVFERAADSNNAHDIARLLRAFEPILLRLASDEIAPADAEELRAQLTFELKALLTKLERGASEDKQTI